MKKITLTALALIAAALPVHTVFAIDELTTAVPVEEAVYEPEFSTAGFFQLDGTGREVLSMNPGWRFMQGDVQGAESVAYDDGDWEEVALPHGIEYLPTEASGCYNYQGVVWYRKHFIAQDEWQGRRTILHFEAIMGKCRIYVNGQLLREHFGGYLPIAVDVTDVLKYHQDNVIAVWADNSNDPSYPPGKNQEVLDFTYCGGIYRDCWLILHSPVHITDANEHCTVPSADAEAAPSAQPFGGLVVAFDHVSAKKADVLLETQVRNTTGSAFRGTVEYELVANDGTRAGRLRLPLTVAAGKEANVKGTLTVSAPHLWSPADPYLYHLNVRVKKGNTVVDGYRQRIGIRSIEFKGKDGFFLNGQRYPHPLMGANRHQDFAVLGNAVPNSIHWRDAKKLKDAGLEVIRNAHCPQDPAFMDACDELGLFIIDNTPGWQFWNDDPLFAERVYDDIRNLVRRDRNHPSLWLWEPILNETHYPADFAARAQATVNEEYPFPGCYSGCDITARGAELFPVQFRHPSAMIDATGNTADSTKTFFTREWGDNVDDWSSHNSNSRVARSWGEVPMLVQAAHYAALEPNITNYDVLYRQPAQHVGGCLWHSFDHQRGYHPDPFYGGLMDAFRQPKYSYYMFQAQRPAATHPMVFIAHEMTPFSPNDVTVYSNCDEVRLTVNAGGKTYTYTKEATEGMPSPIITFADAYHFMEGKMLSARKHGDDVFLLAEGLLNGEVVATHKVVPARRAEKVILWVDDEGTALTADGSDCVVVVAAIADRNGNIKRLNNDYIRFEIEGEGRLLGDASIQANPAPVRWGTAPVIVQATTKPGTIKVRASVLYEGSQKPVSGELTLVSRPAAHPAVHTSLPNLLNLSPVPSQRGGDGDGKATPQEPARNVIRKPVDKAALLEVERQQAEFGE